MNRAEISKADALVEDTGDLARLVDQVADEYSRIIVTRDGEPKAALVSLEDFARLVKESEAAKADKELSWDEWFAKSDELRKRILSRRGGKPIDREIVDQAWQEARTELEERDSRHVGPGR
jgi:prevent-host-death family protein